MNLRTYTLFLLVVVFSLSACDTRPVKPLAEPEKDIRPATEHQVTLTDEAEKLLTLAENSDTEESRLRYQSKAVQLYIEAGEIDQARQQLELIKQEYSGTTPRSATATAAISLITAELAIADKNAQMANQLILEIKPVTRDQQIYYYSLKADLDFLTEKYMYAIDRRVQLTPYLTGSDDKLRNNRKIWAALSRMNSIQLKNQQTSNPTIAGWLDLAKVMRSGQANISKLEDDLLDWGTRNPAHPVSDSFLSELINNYQSEISDKKQIAVILPMQGDLSNITATIKNGILSAYYYDSNSAIKPVIRFYDSSDKDVTFHQLYTQAIEDGASNIIGPLNKIAINRLVQQRELDIPVLTLNYSENSTSYTNNLYQFGLSPEDEARQVAELAVRQGKLRAAVFYPDSEWGKRLNKAFSEHFGLLGGKVLASNDYVTNTNDYRRPIRSMLNLVQSDIRRRKVENTIGKKVHSEPVRRQDLDMIFMVATHHSARGIMPAFKFHHAGDLPVYSTSHVYTGKVNRDLDRDLNGVIFCDLPWILQNHSPLEKVFTDNWPQQENLTRLFALGIDAYHLIYNLDYLENNNYASYDGQTGNIRLDDYNRITRKLLWAKFKSGRPVYFEPVIPKTTIEPDLTASTQSQP